ncbi:MAG: class I SAM-dependent methyltransferase [Candidatus Dormibacteria bacterium]
MTAAQRWREGLAAWAIPQHILDAAPEDPWGHSPEMFARRADDGRDIMTPSRRAAAEALPPGGAVLDVGCGAGAASLPLAGRAGEITGIDPSQAMLDEFVSRMRAAGSGHRTLRGTWAEVGDRAPVADVVLCYHVAYNVAELNDLVAGITAHCRRRVVLELTAQHPLSWLNDLWSRFHGIQRPAGPTADDAAAVLNEAGLEPQRADWEPDATGRRTTFASEEQMVAWVRRRLCLPETRDAEIRDALGDRIQVGPGGDAGFPRRPLVTLWWDVPGGP